MIKPPNRDPDDDDIECQAALEPALLGLIDEALDAGWSRDQVVRSLSDLAGHVWFDDQNFPDDPDQASSAKK